VILITLVLRSKIRYRNSPCLKCNGCGQVTSIDPASLRDIREKSGLSVRAFGKKLGVTGSFICYVENGKRGCPAKLKKRYEALNRRNQRKHNGK
jgi:predicted transcriptional regulator